jgi:hypothetical protein
MSKKFNLWFNQGNNLSGSVKKLDYGAKSEMIEKVKNLALLDEDRYLIDIVTIISETTPDFTYSKNSKSLFFVVDELTDKTISMLHYYVEAVYKKNQRAFQETHDHKNKNFNRLFNSISAQLETEKIPPPPQRLR